MADTPQIWVEDLTVRRGPHTILNHVSFSIQRGEFVTIVGVSGVGKSTLLHAVGGFIPYDGLIEVTGQTGVVLQDASAFPWLTVAGNVGFGLEGMKRSDKAERIRETIRRVGLEGFENRYPAQLSGGELQRLAVARALATGPDVLLLDEPFSALDGPRRTSLQNWLLELWATQLRTVIFVTHDLEECLLLGDRVMVIRGNGSMEIITVPWSRPRPHDLFKYPDFNYLRTYIRELML